MPRYITLTLTLTDTNARANSSKPTLPALGDMTTLAWGGAGSVGGSCVTTRDRPKSQTLTEQSSFSRTFAGCDMGREGGGKNG